MTNLSVAGRAVADVRLAQRIPTTQAVGHESG